MRHQVSEIGKLTELRAQTDRQLATLITNRLNRGFALAERMESDEEIARLVSEIRRLLPAVSRADRARLQTQLTQLENSITFEMSMQAAS
jgi:uncharacterized protein YicC (UPF0701 family)